MMVDFDEILADVAPERRAETRATLEEHYSDIVTTSHRVVWDGTVLRFKVDPVSRWLVDHVDLNELWRTAVREGWPPARVQQLYRDMGYSLCGYADIFHVPCDECPADPWFCHDLKHLPSSN